MRYFAIFLFSISLIGCHNNIPGHVLQKAYLLCERHGGISILAYYPGGYSDVTCLDSTQYKDFNRPDSSPRIENN